MHLFSSRIGSSLVLLLLVVLVAVEVSCFPHGQKKNFYKMVEVDVGSSNNASVEMFFSGGLPRYVGYDPLSIY